MRKLMKRAIRDEQTIHNYRKALFLIKKKLFLLLHNVFQLDTKLQKKEFKLNTKLTEIQFERSNVY